MNFTHIRTRDLQQLFARTAAVMAQLERRCTGSLNGPTI
jgi:hypothetical protein